MLYFVDSNYYLEVRSDLIVITEGVLGSKEFMNGIAQESINASKHK